MRRKMLLPVVAFVLLFGSLQWLAAPVAAQSGSTLSGLLCTDDYDGYADKQMCRGGVLPDATLTLTLAASVLGLGTQSTTSGDGGDWSFAGLADGSYSLHVERAGFEPLDLDVTIPDTDSLELSLTGTKVQAEGAVSDTGGAAIAGASVTLSGRIYQETETGSDGHFAAGLTAGYYSVQIRHSEFRTAYDYRLFDGQATAAFTLEPAPEKTATVTGTVLDQDGAPVAGATVQIDQYGYAMYDTASSPQPASSGSSGASIAYPEPYPYYDDAYQTVKTDAQGSFSAKVYAGHVNLYVHKDGYTQAWQDFEVGDGQSHDVAVSLEKFPDKTAHITGRVTDADSGAGLKWVSVSLQSPRYGIYECSVSSADTGSGDTVEAMPVYYDPGCAITVHPDGSFEGDVTPGYTILSVYYDHWRSCTESQDSDGSYTRSCGKDYFGYTQTLDLAADGTTDISVAMTPRPGPDAVLSGYVVDKETQKAISGVQVSISNQDNYGYAWATTDDDGSYKVRIRSGYHQVSVWADGYLQWQGVVEVKSGSETPFDILLTQGENRYGYCCYADHRVMTAGASEATDAAPSGVATTAVPTAASQATSTEDFEDLGGGLGPYDPQARAQALQEGSQDTPAPGLVLAGAALGVALYLRRRR